MSPLCLLPCAFCGTVQVSLFVKQLVGTYGTIDYVDVVATARAFKALQRSVRSWRRRMTGVTAKAFSSPISTQSLREQLNDRFREHDPEGTGLIGLQAFRRLASNLGLKLRGKEFDAMVALVATTAPQLVHSNDAADVLAGGIEHMVSARRKVNLALQQFRKQDSMGRLFPAGATSALLSHVLTRLGLSMQPRAFSDRQLDRAARGRDDVAATHVRAVPSDSDEDDHQLHGSQGGGDDAGVSYTGLEVDSRLQELRQAKLLRARRKRLVAEAILGQNNSTNIFLYPVVGTPEFFEFNLTNPWSSAETVVVEVDDPLKEGALRLVTSAEEWYAHRHTQHRLFNRRFAGSVEDDMFASNQATQLGPHETVPIPFVFQSMRCEANGREGSGKKQDERVIDVFFRCPERHLNVAVLRLHIVPCGAVVQKTIRLFSQAERTNRVALHFLSSSQTDSTGAIRPLLRAACSSPDIVVEPAAQHSDGDLQQTQGCVRLRYRCRPFPAVNSFFLVVYADAFDTAVFGVFRVMVYSVAQEGISAALGGDARVELVYRPRSWRPRRGGGSLVQCRLFSSRPQDVGFAPSGNFKLDMLQSTSTVLVKFRPTAVEPGACEHAVVTLVNQELGEVLFMWLLSAAVGPAQVTQVFTVDVRHCMIGLSRAPRAA
jgi:hypothetical protein